LDIELLIVLAGSFFGLIFIVVIALQNLGNRIEDKLGNRDTLLASKFDLLIDKIGVIASDISFIKEFSRQIQTVDFQLEKSGLTGRITTRPDEFTPERLSYVIRFTEPINQTRLMSVIAKLSTKKIKVVGSGAKLLVINIRSVDLDENASLIKTLLQRLDDELSDDRSKEITESIEKKLKEIL